jgi:ankyrin repeat protein
VSLAQVLLAAGAPVEAADNRGDTPLLLAIRENESNALPAICQVLLSYGADPNVASSDGHTPLSLATEMGLAEVAALLREHGALTEATEHPTD